VILYELYELNNIQTTRVQKNYNLSIHKIVLIKEETPLYTKNYSIALRLIYNKFLNEI